MSIVAAARQTGKGRRRANAGAVAETNCKASGKGGGDQWHTNAENSYGKPPRLEPRRSRARMTETRPPKSHRN